MDGSEVNGEGPLYMAPQIPENLCIFPLSGNATLSGISSSQKSPAGFTLAATGATVSPCGDLGWIGLSVKLACLIQISHL